MKRLTRAWFRNGKKLGNCVKDESKSTTVSRHLSLLIGRTEIGSGGGNRRVEERRIGRYSRLAVTISVGKTKIVDGWKEEGSKEASELELIEADGFEEPRAAANGRDCLPKAKRNDKSRATTYEGFHRVLYSLQQLNFLFVPQESKTSEQTVTWPESGCQGLEVWDLLKMRPCPSLGPHAGDGWTCTSIRLAAGHEINGIWKKRTAIMSVMSRLEMTDQVDVSVVVVVC